MNNVVLTLKCFRFFFTAKFEGLQFCHPLILYTVLPRKLPVPNSLSNLWLLLFSDCKALNETLTTKRAPKLAVSKLAVPKILSLIGELKVLLYLFV